MHISLHTITKRMEENPLTWAHYYQEEGIEELKNCLLYTTLELETTILSAQEQIARKDGELLHLKGLLTRVMKERDEALERCKKLIMLDKVFLLQQNPEQVQNQNGEFAASLNGIATTSSEIGVSNSDSDETVTGSSPGGDTIRHPPLAYLTPELLTEKLIPKRPLPEKGKFLQAVVEAGPLLQTLLLAGPLPQWQHPPPQLNSVDIPPVTVSSPAAMLLHQDSCLSVSSDYCNNKKRNFISNEALDSPPNIKYQKVAHQSSLTNIYCSTMIS